MESQHNRLCKTYPIHAERDMRAINSFILAITQAPMAQELELIQPIPRTPNGSVLSPIQWATYYSSFFVSPNPQHSRRHHNKAQAYCLDSALGSDFSLASAPATPAGLEK